MQIGILGSGNIGGNAARLFARAGHHVRIANSRGPQSLRALVAEIGPERRGDEAQDAVDASDLVMIAVPGRSVRRRWARSRAGTTRS